MAEENPKIEIKDFNSPIEDTRLQYLEENDNLIKGRRGFLFAGFKNEKERIKEQIKKNDIYNNSLENTYLKKSQKKIINKSSSLPVLLNEKYKIISTPQYVQPFMRFKPRTDLERIYDSVNLNYYGSINRKIVDRQLKYLDLNNPMKIDENNNVNSKSAKNLDEIQEAKEKNYIIDNYKNEENDNNEKKISNKRILNYLPKKFINMDSKKIMQYFHYKTHFKAIQSLALSRDKIIKNYLSKKYFQPEHLEKISDNEELEKENNEIQKYINSQKYNHLINNRSYYLNNNQRLHNIKKSNSTEDIQKLKDLEKIAFQKDDFLTMDLKTKTIKDNDEDFKSYDNRIKIGNKIYYLNEEMDKAANAILNKCNVNHKKNKSNQGQLINGNGKLMMTNGLTINQFLTKYNL